MAARTFRSMPFGAGVSPQALGRPTSTFPSAIATDADLTIAVNRLQTRLAAPLDAISTTMTVADASLIVANVQLSIDGEIVRTTADPTGQTVPIARGFDGTTPALHLSGAVVSGYVNAWHHNKLVAEVEAIETALGPNLSRIPSSPFVVSGAFEFMPQTPGGSLIIGANTITLTPVPLGVNGTDTNHWVYISGGTGTAEAAKIIGGSAIAGAASGSLIIQCANTHSGAWTIRTATGGIQEAIVSLQPTTGTYIDMGTGGGTIYIPVGVHLIYASIYLPSNITLLGGSSKSCILRSQGTTIIQTVPGTVAASVQNVAIDLNVKNNIVGLLLTGSFSGIYRNIYICNGQSTTGSIGVHMLATVLPGGIGNCTDNLLECIHAEWGPDRCLVLEGTGAVGDCAVTLNTIRQCRLSGSAGPIIDLVKNTDTNYLYDMDINSGTAGSGITFNSGNPSAANGVGVFYIRNITFEGGSSGTALQFANTNQNQVENVWNAWGTPFNYSQTGTTTTTIMNLYGFGVPGTQISHWSTDGFVIGSSVSGLGSYAAFPHSVVNLVNGANQNIPLLNGSYGVIAGPTAAFSIGGFLGGQDGRLLYLFNASSVAMTIKNQDAGSAAAARILTLTGADVVLRASRSFATFIYDSINQLWILTSTN